MAQNALGFGFQVSGFGNCKLFSTNVLLPKFRHPTPETPGNVQSDFLEWTRFCFPEVGEGRRSGGATEERALSRCAGLLACWGHYALAWSVPGPEAASAIHER